MRTTEARSPDAVVHVREDVEPYNTKLVPLGGLRNLRWMMPEEYEAWSDGRRRKRPVLAADVPLDALWPTHAAEALAKGQEMASAAFGIPATGTQTVVILKKDNDPHLYAHLEIVALTGAGANPSVSSR